MSGSCTRCRALINAGLLLWCLLPADRSEKQRTPRRRELERKQQLDVERWLKEKFREGFFSMRKEFEDRDTEKKGIVSRVFRKDHFDA